MALAITQLPPLYHSAYKPMLVGVTSTRSPVNQTAGEYGITASTIKLADAADVVLYGGTLEVGDLFIFHASTPLDVWPPGQMISIESSTITEYDGQWRVLKQVTDKVTVIDAPDYGEATSAILSKYYENYTLIVDVLPTDADGTRTYRLAPDEDGVFWLDPSDYIQSLFGSVFDIAEGGQVTDAILADGYITMGWTALFTEGYNIPDDDGINVFTEMGKDGFTLNASERIAVNSVQPYHHINEGTGEPDYLWEDDLSPYQIATTGTAKLLTYHPDGGTDITTGIDTRTAQRIALTDDAWIAFLWTGGAETIRLRKYYKNADGSATSTFQDLTVDGDSYLLNVGPTALSIPATALYYNVSLYYGNDRISNYLFFQVDEECYGSPRLFAMNSFGAIEQYTVDGSREGRTTSVKRTLVSKPNMATTLGVGGDYNRRTRAVDIVRGYYASTRTESREILRWISDEIIESVDVRLQVYNGDEPVYTPVIIETDKADVGVKSGRLNLEWSLGVDNRKQRL